MQDFFYFMLQEFVCEIQVNTWAPSVTDLYFYVKYFVKCYEINETVNFLISFIPEYQKGF